MKCALRRASRAGLFTLLAVACGAPSETRTQAASRIEPAAGAEAPPRATAPADGVAAASDPRDRAQDDEAARGEAERGSAERGSAERGSAERGSAERGSAERGADRDEVESDDPAPPAATRGSAESAPSLAESTAPRVPAEPAATEPAPGPLAPEVVAHVREIAARRARRDDVFIKVGDSATVNRAFMQCFHDDDEVDLGAHADLAPLVSRIRAARVRGTDSFGRDSRAAGVGWSVYRAISGRSSAIGEEVHAMSPRFALVMFGGNDVETGSLGRYRRRMNELVDRLTRWGVVPVLSTIPPRNDDPEADAQVPRFNAFLRHMAAERRLPLVDLHAVLVDLPDRGLASDGVHPSAPVRGGRAYGCDLSDAGLAHGQNVRNLLNLRMLEALRAALAP